MKIALAQLNYHIGNFTQNVRKIRESIQRAKSAGADLVVFSELAICGYPPRDFLEFKEFVDLCQLHLKEIASDCIGISAVVGCPIRNEGSRGKKLFNAACYLADGQVQFIQRKTLLPTYDIFDEYRYFEPNNEYGLVECAGKKIALTICEDIWDIGKQKLYEKNPVAALIDLKPDLMINLSASPFSRQQRTSRMEVVTKTARENQLPLIYVNHIGAQTELIFDGQSLVCNEKGKVVMKLRAFEEDFAIFDTDQTDHVIHAGRDETDEVLNALITGVRDYFKKSGFSSAVVGLSGGIDSALTLVIACMALGPGHVKAVLMPSPYSSDHSVNDSIELVNRLGCKHDVIPIHDAIGALDHTLNPFFEGLPKDLTEENIQARIRGTLLMALSNKFGYILLNTTNKSEMAVGYGTLYGDLCGGLSVLGDIYKTEVYQLARHVNIKREIIPLHILEKEPSAELRFDQKDTDSLPDYEELDPVLKLYIEGNKSAPEIIEMGFDEDLVRGILTLVNRNEYKRHQSAPILRVTNKAFGMGRRMPIVGKYLS